MLTKPRLSTKPEASIVGAVIACLLRDETRAARGARKIVNEPRVVRATRPTSQSRAGGAIVAPGFVKSHPGFP